MNYFYVSSDTQSGVAIIYSPNNMHVCTVLRSEVGDDFENHACELVDLLNGKPTQYFHEKTVVTDDDGNITGLQG